MAYPTYVNQIYVQAKDWDLTSGDDTLGSTKFNLSSLKPGSVFEKPFWCNIYGAPPTATKDKVSNEMNKYPEIGTPV